MEQEALYALIEKTKQIKLKFEELNVAEQQTIIDIINSVQESRHVELSKDEVLKAINDSKGCPECYNRKIISAIKFSLKFGDYKIRALNSQFLDDIT